METARSYVSKKILAFCTCRYIVTITEISSQELAQSRRLVEALERWVVVASSLFLALLEALLVLRSLKSMKNSEVPGFLSERTVFWWRNEGC